MRTFFRSLFRGEEGVSDELAHRLADVCERHINRMLVWNGEPSVKARDAESLVSEPASGEAVAGANNDVASAEEDAEVSYGANEAGAPWSVAHLETTGAGDAAVGEETGDVSTAPFDPFAFSVVVVLARSGADALMARLEEIDDADDLRALADAQHLGVDAGLRGDAAALRDAIVEGAQQRLADRRAAAS